MHEHDVDRTLRARLAGLTERRDHVAGRGACKVQSLGRIGVVHRRDVDVGLRHERSVALFADQLERAAHHHSHIRHVVAEWQLEHGRFVVDEHERLRLRRRDAVAIGQRDVPRRALEQRERGRCFTAPQAHARDRLGRTTGGQLLAVEREVELERVALVRELEPLDLREIAVHQQHR